jgi:FkbM family methyltransferase
MERNENDPVLFYEGFALINAPHATEVAEEVIDRDCYQVSNIPVNSMVIDIGGFYGEFALHVALARFCRVHVYEPHYMNFEILQANIMINGQDNTIIPYDQAVSDKFGDVGIISHPENTAKSAICATSSSEHGTIATTMDEVIKRAMIAAGTCGNDSISVKIDCEGSEAEIFSTTKWIAFVDYVAMEWHNSDGHIYADILQQRGFDVELSGCDGAPYDSSFLGGLLIAKRK